MQYKNRDSFKSYLYKQQCLHKHYLIKYTNKYSYLNKYYMSKHRELPYRCFHQNIQTSWDLLLIFKMKR